MNKEILKKIIDTQSVSFSYEEIQSLLDEELEKSPDDMDTELVDMCIEALEKAESSHSTDRKKPSIKKVILIAAVVAVILILAIPVGARVLNIDVFDGTIVEVLKDRIVLNFAKNENDQTEESESLTQENEESDLHAQIAEFQLTDVVIPSVFFSEDVCITKAEEMQNDYFYFEFEFLNTDCNGNFSIAVSNDATIEAFALRRLYLFEKIENLKQLKVDGLNIYIYSTVSDECSVFYDDTRIGCSYSYYFNGIKYEDVLKLFEGI